MRSKRSAAAALSAALVCGVAAAAASGDAIGGATYTGTAADGARVAITISPDGTLVTSYRITNISQPCQFAAGGDTGIWAGAPIVSGAFSYRLANAISLRGSFDGAKGASGTFRLYTAATHSTQACDTGVVSWTATTTATPPARGAGHGPRFLTRVAFREVSPNRFQGRLRARRRACRAGRTVMLWLGGQRVVKARSSADGTFSFTYPATAGGLGLRASVGARPVRGGVCTAGSSAFILAS